jgi:hypothetical protein
VLIPFSFIEELSVEAGMTSTVAVTIALKEGVVDAIFLLGREGHLLLLCQLSQGSISVTKAAVDCLLTVHSLLNHAVQMLAGFHIRLVVLLRIAGL